MRSVIILGAGISGVSTAIRLAQLNRKVSIVTKIERKPRLHEALNFSLKDSLDELNIYDDFIKTSPLTCPEKTTKWGNDKLNYYDLGISNERKGWLIDPIKMEDLLISKAKELGVEFFYFEGTIEVVKHKNNTWSIIDSSTKNSLDAPFLVDATGKTSWLARNQRVRRIHEDRQIALIGTLKCSSCTSEEEFAKNCIVESVEYGWWHCSPVINGKITCILYTDPDVINANKYRKSSQFVELIEKTTYIKKRVNQCNQTWEGDIKAIEVNSSKLEKVIGDRWLAVGDAAMACDPIAFHGLTIAILSGIEAAKCINSFENGDINALERYQTVVTKLHYYYDSERKKSYALEYSWPHSYYWKRRLSLVSLDPLI